MKRIPIRLITLACFSAISLIFLCGGGRPEAHIYQQFRGASCEVCGSVDKLEWAHAYPYNMSIGDKAYLITEQTNGVTLCRKCHECIGHYNNTGKYWNSDLLNIVQQLKTAKAEYTR